MGQASSQQSSTTNSTSSQLPGQCPIQHQRPAECPVQNQAAECPIKHDLNPANQMTELSQLPSTSQTIQLPTERTISSIPRPLTGSESPGRWDYPSPQQFYNALVRKGFETPEEHVETMVEIHNFLNEKAWEEVVQWERRRPGAEEESPQLARLTGRPGDISPKARLFMLAGWLMPNKFNSEPPFDRHDWIVHRPKTKEDIRYVIDYYSAPPEPDGSPVFSLDVRPALDNWWSVKERLRAASEDLAKSWKEDQMPSKSTPDKSS